MARADESDGSFLAYGPRIAVVTHGQASSPFWAIVRTGVEAAQRQMNVQVGYEAPDVYSLPRMIELSAAGRAGWSSPHSTSARLPALSENTSATARGRTEKERPRLLDIYATWLRLACGANVTPAKVSGRSSERTIQRTV